MASLTKSDQGNQAMADEQSSEDNEREHLPAKSGGGSGGGGGATATAAVPPRGGGFFTIYKRGQGYWTRMGTALGAALIAVLTAHFVYAQMRSIPYTWNEGNPVYIPFKVCLATSLVVFFAIILFAWRLMNKPANADFLIATDSEMKKVNWTTRKELIGSTKVVIVFVFLISALLFLLDLVFGYFFQLIRVLEFGPFQS
jgi:preprotein translocase SecE subunit